MGSLSRCCNRRGWVATLFPVLLGMDASTIEALQAHMPSRQTFAARYPSTLSMHSLTTCLESLSLERRNSVDQYRHVSWLDLSQQEAQQDGDLDDFDHDSISMPLYPLGAVYLPTNHTVNHTLINVEPQNIQMAQDLLHEAFVLDGQQHQIVTDPANRPRFCVVLRAMDTGRIASVGTVMSIVEAEKQFHYGTEDIARIRLTCHAEQLIKICHVENGDGWSAKRLMRSQEYLRASVRPFLPTSETATENAKNIQEQLSELSKDWTTVKTMYQLDLGSGGFPPGTISKLGDAIQEVNIEARKDGICRGSEDSLERTFWTFAQEWQSVCYTLRQGQQSLLSAERNELMVEAACAKGSPLKLPIHMEDLEPQHRTQIQLLEGKAQQRHVELGMDPVLDFQVLISQPNIQHCAEWLHFLVKRERQRLESIVAVQYSK
ncbi:hypothetical protein IV203_002749 [Nitzschia inconspicua]|uniref:Uncharacterized protein n=1 Tax=Nitzschia inconspicua TaxID=303405 RepID=A0A9K3L1D8_9STRA|nr:hypothetical protein IV203_002749 [Nitzschia inconspicua]